MGILMGGVIRSAVTHGPLPFANACVSGTLHCYGTDGNGIWNNLSDGGAYAYSGVSMTFHAGGFYDQTVSLNTVGYYPDLGINGLWQVVELQPQPQDPNSCFTPETLVWMADGTQRPIGTIRIDDRVCCHDGRTARVIGIDIHHLDTADLASFGDDAEFVTTEHPFLSPDGWRAISAPRASLFHPELGIAPLLAGATLLRAVSVRQLVMAGGEANAALDVELIPATIGEIKTRRAPHGQPVINLRLDRGHTYIANGFVVHNKSSSH